ncbi:AMP-binding protein [Vibrio vulnificus]
MSHPLPFHSLATLFHHGRAPRHQVAFSLNEHHDWSSFSCQVHSLCEQMKQTEARRVALCAANSYQFAIGFFALCFSGKAIVLPGNYQPAALDELSCEFDLLLCDEEVGSNLRQAYQLISGTLSTCKPASFPHLLLEQVGLTLFTSGSSGTPKAIRKTLQQLDSEIAVLEQLFGQQLQDCRIESTVSHQHIYGLLFRVLWPLCAGRAFAQTNLEYPEQLVAHASDQTALISSPALLKRLTSEHHSSPFACVFSSGGPLSYAAAMHAQTLFSQTPWEVFGSTETGGIACRQQHQANTPWQLFPGIDVELNQENCLRLRSPHIDGENWYQTADECEMVSERQFLLKGRTDRVIKLEEKRISLVEVEKRLDHLDWINESVVIPMTESDRLTLVAAIVLTSAGTTKLNELGKGKFWLLLRGELRQWLEPIAIPRRYRVVSEIPLNSQGKRLTNQIEQLFH